MGSTLHLADDSSWRLDPEYSPLIASVLSASYARAWGSQSPSAAALTLVPLIQVAHLPMAPMQRLRVCYLMAVAASNLGEHALAIECIDEAVELAVQRGLTGDLADLLSLRGNVHRRSNRFRDATEDLRDCLALLREESDARGPADVRSEVLLLAELSGFEFFLAHFDEAQRLIEEAKKRAASLSPRVLEDGLIGWSEVLLERWRQRPELALLPADRAAAAFAMEQPSATSVRVHVLSAEVYLDMAENLHGSAGRGGCAASARKHVARAREFARQAEDREGALLARLADLRWSRITGQNTSRVAELEDLIRAARRMADAALEVQATTTLGKELEVLGESEQALNLYRLVLARLEGTDVPALGTWARRALLRDQEMGGERRGDV
jgi:tetratricopeptide (TPR) repeat protein